MKDLQMSFNAMKKDAMYNQSQEDKENAQHWLDRYIVLQSNYDQVAYELSLSLKSFDQLTRALRETHERNDVLEQHAYGEDAKEFEKV